MSQPPNLRDGICCGTCPNWKRDPCYDSGDSECDGSCLGHEWHACTDTDVCDDHPALKAKPEVRK